MKSTERFSDRVENYVKYRPHYPAAVIQCLESEGGLSADSVVADIGAGTGISSLPFLENGNKVFAVEPNKEMRDMCISLLHHFPKFTAVDGTAEDTTLPDASVDFIVAGQAFHWFDRQLSKKEFRRIARNGAVVALIWNERLTNSEFEKAYEELLLTHAVDYTKVDHRNIDSAQIAKFFSPALHKEYVFENHQLFDLEGLKGRLQSSSYTPPHDHHSYASMMDNLREMFDVHSVNDQVKFNYETKLFIGEIMLEL